MFQQLIILIFIIFSFANIPCWSQEQSLLKNEQNKTTLGIDFGTGFFQHVQMDLTNFNQEVIATSDNLIPTNIKAKFSYYFTPKIAVRFSSGYGFSQQKNRSEVDYGKIDSLDVKTADESIFSINGFPSEIAFLFQNAIDNNENILLNIGIGFGYYIYNFRAEGSYDESTSESNEKKWEENYRNSEMTLSGGAQFFVLGLNINFGQNVGASFEVSKIGLSFMKLTHDIVKQEIYEREINNEIKYGFRQKDYNIRKGFDDLALSIGIYWRL